MIHVELAKVEMRGFGDTIFAELACAMHAVYEKMVEQAGEKAAWEMMQEIVSLALTGRSLNDEVSRDVGLLDD